MKSILAIIAASPLLLLTLNALIYKWPYELPSKDLPKEVRFKEFSDVMNHYGDGYDWEPHEVITEDGYILNMFRLTANELGEPITAPKGPLFLQHGLTVNAANWFTGKTTQLASSLPIVLARAGYDVWLGNTRGTNFSLGHTKLDPYIGKGYWDFSWAELGKYDLSAMIDYVYNYTESKAISYVGHSQGTTAMFYGLAHNDQEDFATKLKQVVAIAPCFVIDMNDPRIPA